MAEGIISVSKYGINGVISKSAKRVMKMKAAAVMAKISMARHNMNRRRNGSGGNGVWRNKYERQWREDVMANSAKMKIIGGSGNESAAAAQSGSHNGEIMLKNKQQNGNIGLKAKYHVAKAAKYEAEI